MTKTDKTEKEPHQFKFTTENIEGVIVINKLRIGEWKKDTGSWVHVKLNTMAFQSMDDAKEAIGSLIKYFDEPVLTNQGILYSVLSEKD